MLIGNAPCSWGINYPTGSRYTWEQYLDQVAEAGYRPAQDDHPQHLVLGHVDRADIATVFIGSTVAMGLSAANRRLGRGEVGATEFGHMNHVPGGARCRCGMRGCGIDHTSRWCPGTQAGLGQGCRWPATPSPRK